MNIYNQGSAQNNTITYLEAVKELRTYLKNDIDPVILGKTLSKGRLVSEYDTFKQELKEKDIEEYNKHIAQVEFFNKRYLELLRYENGKLLRTAYEDAKNYKKN